MIRRFIKLCCAIEPIIAHMKIGYMMDCRWFRCEDRYHLNALMMACGFNIKKTPEGFCAVTQELIYLVYSALSSRKAAYEPHML